MEGDIPGDISSDILREIPRQDDEIHVSGSIKNDGLRITGASVIIRGTFGPRK